MDREEFEKWIEENRQNDSMYPFDEHVVRALYDELTKEQQWTPVSDGMPEVFRDVLVTTINERVVTARLLPTGEWKEWFGGVIEVIAWRSIVKVEPYKVK